MIITRSDVNNLQQPSFKHFRKTGSEDYLFVLFKSPAHVLINGDYTEVNEGICTVFDKRKIQSYYPLNGTSFLHDYMHFDIETDYEKSVFSEIPLGKLIHIPLPDAISNLLTEIKREIYGDSSRYKHEILTELGLAFLYRLKSFSEERAIAPAKRHQFNLLYQMRDEIYRSPNLDWTVDGICNRVCMSRSYMQHLYKEFFSVSCIEDVIRARLKLASSLLQNGSHTVAEIAERCGYGNPEHFSRQFKHFIGISPKEFREK